MENKKNNVPSSTVTRDLNKFSEPTGNIYESVAIMAKRANQISVEMKKELESKLQEFTTYSDSLEEVSESLEQIEISRYYEKLPKATLVAAKEFEKGEIYYRNPAKRLNEEEEDTIL